jgi:PilZ domain
MDCQVSIGTYASGTATTKREHEDRSWISCIRNTRCSQRSILSSFPVAEMIASHTTTRRWQRYPVDLPVRILPCTRLPATAITGRGTELSRGGMALYTGVDMEPNDLMEVEFLSPHPFKVMATVRNRSGHHFGLEFLARLPRQASGLPKNRPPALPKPPAKIAGNERITDCPLVIKVFAAIDRKSLEIARLQREIDALLIAARLLAQ